MLEEAQQDFEKIEEEETEETEEFSPRQFPVFTEGSASGAADTDRSMERVNTRDSEEETNNGEQTNEDNNHEGKLSLESTSDTEADRLKEEGDFSTETTEKTVPENARTCDIDARVQKTNDLEEEEEKVAESEPEITIQRTDTACEVVPKEESQILIKCSQGFGFF